jgi:hypothetical protein
MPDYASILRRSISALPEQTPEMREAVYQRARAALARQLTAVDPPLSTREIELQHQDLEDAVARLEADFAPPPAELPVEDFPAEDEFFNRPTEASFDRTEPRVHAEEARRAPPVSRDYDREDDEEDEQEEDFDDEEPRASGLPLLAGIAVVVLLIIGAGIYAYSADGGLLGMFGLSGAKRVAAVEPVRVSTTTEPAPEPERPAAVVSEKNAERMTNGAEPPPAAVPPAEETVAAAPSEPAPLPVLPTDVAPSTEPSTAETPTPQKEQTAALPEPGQSIVAQRAIYYFQGAQGAAGKAVEGTVNWTQTSRENAPAIQATLRINNPSVSTTVTIYKNKDASLPASHLVEVQFSGELGPSPVQRVPALVLKQTEQARGQPLVGAAVPVTNDLFWIALSDDAEQVSRNLQLLREGSWFDIPILFNDGTRALLTFEKGIPGDKLFETVLAAWNSP